MSCLKKQPRRNTNEENKDNKDKLDRRRRPSPRLLVMTHRTKRQRHGYRPPTTYSASVAPSPSSSSGANASLTARPTLVGTRLIDRPSLVGTLLSATARRCMSSCFVGSLEMATTPGPSRSSPAKTPALNGDPPQPGCVFASRCVQWMHSGGGGGEEQPEAFCRSEATDTKRKKRPDVVRHPNRTNPLERAGMNHAADG